jgi:hypothetical protein
MDSLPDTPADFQNKRMALHHLGEVKELLESVGEVEYDKKAAMVQLGAAEELLLASMNPVGEPYSIA